MMVMISEEDHSSPHFAPQSVSQAAPLDRDTSHSPTTLVLFLLLLFHFECDTSHSPTLTTLCLLLLLFHIYFLHLFGLLDLKTATQVIPQHYNNKTSHFFCFFSFIFPYFTFSIG